MIIALVIAGVAWAADPPDVHVVFDPPRMVVGGDEAAADVPHPDIPVEGAPGGTAAAPSGDDVRLLREQIAAQQAEIDELRAAITDLKAKPASEAPADSDGPRTGYGKPVVVAPGDVVDDVTSFGDDVRVAGHVLGDATSFGGNVQILSTGVVDGDATSFGGQVDIDPGGSVHGDRVAFADEEATAPLAEGSILDDLRHRLVLLLSFAGAGVLVVGLAPNRVGRIATAIEQHPVRSATVGVVASGVLLIASLLFTVTIVGLPVAFLLLAVLGLAWLTGFVGLCQAIGDRLPFAEKQHGRWLAFLVGTVVVSFAGALPWVGWLVVLAGSLIGMGGALRSRFGGR